METISNIDKKKKIKKGFRVGNKYKFKSILKNK